MDIFVLAHVLGWVGKIVMFRDFKLCIVLSLLFELMEYTFEFLQPNFVECWWDHWVLDFAVCNMAGIFAGQALLSWLDSRTYDWAGRSLAEIPTIRGKALRLLQQLTPASWTPYRWSMLSDLRRLGYVLAVCAGAMVVELDAFFLKDIFWVPPASVANVYRLLIWFAVGMVGLRDFYAFMDDARIKRLGSTAWVMLAMMALELLVVVKFAPELYKGKAIPATVVAIWAAAAAAFTAWVVWWYFLRGKKSRHAADAPRPAAALPPPPPPAAAGALPPPPAAAAAGRRKRAASTAPPPPPPAAASPKPAGRGGRELGGLLSFDLRFDASPVAAVDHGARRRK
jgi:phosphatidylserine synthase 2